MPCSTHLTTLTFQIKQAITLQADIAPRGLHNCAFMLYSSCLKVLCRCSLVTSQSYKVRHGLVYFHICLHTHTHTHTHTHSHTHMHMNTHTHTHVHNTQTNKQTNSHTPFRPPTHVPRRDHTILTHRPLILQTCCKRNRPHRYFLCLTHLQGTKKSRNLRKYMTLLVTGCACINYPYAAKMYIVISMQIQSHVDQY